MPEASRYLQAPERYHLFQHAPLLGDLLAPYPQVQVVLSTSWVRQYRYSGAAKRLPESLRNRVIGATYHSHMENPWFWDKPRWKQIWEDVCRRRPGSWLALDNDVADWPPQLAGHLVAADDIDGIHPPRIQAELRMRLQQLAELRLPPLYPPEGSF